MPASWPRALSSWIHRCKWPTERNAMLKTTQLHPARRGEARRSPRDSTDQDGAARLNASGHWAGLSEQSRARTHRRNRRQAPRELRCARSSRRQGASSSPKR
eukprot:1363704-Pyramimonas_sp.AAC.1